MVSKCNGKTWYYKVMKANEAPEKIYLHPDIGDREFIKSWLKIRVSQESVEYIRTDAFIEKVLDFFENDLCCYIKAQDFTIDHERLETDFKIYIKGD